MIDHALPFPTISGKEEIEPGRTAAVFGSTDQHGRTLDALTRESPLLLVFLRHLGCTFCREAAADVAKQRASIEGEGVVPAFVGMSEERELGAFLEAYGLGDLPRFADPDRALYRAFGLVRGGIHQLAGPEVLRRGIAAAAPAWLGGGGHGAGALRGDGLQMPGVFLLHHGKVIGGHRHRTAADRPDYSSLACEAR